MNDMEKAVLDIIEKKYKRKYTGRLKITKLGMGWAGYRLHMESCSLDPQSIDIAADLEAEDFLKFVERELVERQLHKVQYFTGIKIEQPEDEVGRTY